MAGRLLSENDCARTNLIGDVDFGFGEGGRGLERDHLFVALDRGGSEVALGDGVLELLEERSERDGVASALIVGCASGFLGYLLKIALAAEAAASSAKAGIVVVDGVDGYAGTLRIGDGSGDVGTVLIGNAGAAVVGIDTIGDHENEAGFVC